MHKLYNYKDRAFESADLDVARWINAFRENGSSIAARCNITTNHIPLLPIQASAEQTLQ